MTIYEDGSSVLIEAVYYQHGVVKAGEHDTLDEATGWLEYGEEHEVLSAVGVFVDRLPARYREELRRPTSAEAEDMRADYRKVAR